MHSPHRGETCDAGARAKLRDVRTPVEPRLRRDFVWDDLRYFLALARTGTLSEAARTLGVNHATVSRRIQALEDACGGKLFVRAGQRYLVSERGRALEGAAGDAETSIHHCARAIAGVDTAIDGIVRISTTQLLAQLLVLPLARDLRETNPAIVLDVIETTRMARLTHQEADLALRMILGGGTAGGDAVLTNRLGEFGWRLAASPALLAAHKIAAPRDPDARPPALDGLPVALFDDEAPGRVGSAWLAGSQQRLPVVLYASSLYALARVAADGFAAAFLPVPYAELLGLRCLSPEVEVTGVQLMVHPDLRHQPRIRTVRDALIAHARRVPWLRAGRPARRR